MNKITGTYFDGRHPLGSVAALIWLRHEVSVIGEHVSEKHPLSGLQISPRIGSADRFISLPGGAQLQCEDTPLLDLIPQQGTTEGMIAWLEQRWGMALFGIVVIVAMIPAGYFYGLPRFAEYVATRIPRSTEREVGDTTFRWLDNHGLFKPSNVGCESQKELRSDFHALVQGVSPDYNYRLLFRDAPGLGANAIALPGGIIVITDGMMKLTDSPEQALAVLAHETGHVVLRHALRHAIQNSGIAAAITAVTGDAASLTSVITGLPVVLAQANYSRDFEADADAYAFELLKQHGVSPANFAEIMEKLEHKNYGKTGNVSFLASHPPTPERILRARTASAGFDSAAKRNPSSRSWPLWSKSPNCSDAAAR